MFQHQWFISSSRYSVLWLSPFPNISDKKKTTCFKKKYILNNNKNVNVIMLILTNKKVNPQNVKHKDLNPALTSRIDKRKIYITLSLS